MRDAGQRQISRTGVVRISLEPFRPLLAVARKQAVVFQRHRVEVDRAIQAIGHAGIREHFVMELVHNAEERCVSDDVYVILVSQRRSVGVTTPPVSVCDEMTDRMVVWRRLVPPVGISHDTGSQQ